MKPKVAVFRPAGERIETASALLAELGVEPVADPMLTTEATGAVARTDGDYTVVTSTTGVGILADHDWQAETTLCAIGSTTADALRETGYTVDIVPEEFSSAGLVERLTDEVDGKRVEIARSDHGSEVLPDGLTDAGGYVHETTLYRLTRPTESGRSARLAADGELAGVAFTSPLTVEFFLDAAAETASREAVRAALDEAVVGCIGEPTREAAREAGFGVDVVPASASFDALARDVVEAVEE
ncbi:uroporphyrinogen-III synthase [Halosegnis longus]|uniref:uroporphyrinogen-III synthase n=1 Tax=Halosegnis longus TaxID=2216012 RepID=UPI00129DF92C|nr:uroporphyrinogen-III synthase [Halosegnis longus]